MLRSLLCLTTACLVTACATGSSSDVARDGTGPLLGLESDPHRAPWADWSPSPGRSTPGDIDKSMTRFDGWRTSTRETVEEAWRGVFPILDRLARGGAAPTERAPADSDPYWAALHLLEPGASNQPPVTMEATYLVRPADFQGPPREGLALRFYRDIQINGASETAASVTIWMTRRPSAGRTPDHIVVWVQSGFAETGGATAVFARNNSRDSASGESSTWQVNTVAGSLLPPEWRSDGSPPDQSTASNRRDQLSLIPTILTDNLWSPHVGPAYAASNRTPADAPAPPSPMKPFLGLERQGRGIERVYSNSVFPPRPPELGAEN